MQIFGMSRPLGADYNKDKSRGWCEGTKEDCKRILRRILPKIFNTRYEDKNIDGYINLEKIEDREDTKDYEKEIWDNLTNNTYKYLNLPTGDMKCISEVHLSELIDYYEVQKDTPFVIHCACGKGRTGNAVLLLKLLIRFETAVPASVVVPIVLVSKN